MKNELKPTEVKGVVLKHTKTTVRTEALQIPFKECTIELYCDGPVKISSEGLLLEIAESNFIALQVKSPLQGVPDEVRLFSKADIKEITLR